MNLIRIETSKKKDKKKRYILLVTDTCDIELKHNDLKNLTAAEIKTLIESYCGVMPNLFIHINDDDSLAVAIGQEPTIWPEDDAG